MARWLFAKQQVNAPTEAVQRLLTEDLRALLQSATDVPVTEPDGDGSFLIELPGRFLGVDLSKRVRVRIGVASASGGLLRVPLSWHADPARGAFPTFDGHLEYEGVGSYGGEVVLVGRYTGPLGLVGALGDAVVTAGAANRTADLLLRRLVDRLEEVATGEEVVGTVFGPGMHVGDVMTPDPIVLDEDTPLRVAALLLLHRDISGAPVVDSAGRLVGVLSESDLLHKEAVPRWGIGRKAADADRRVRAKTVGQACTRPARTTSVDSSLRSAATLMARHDVNRLVVLGGARIEGIITRHDVLKALTRTDVDLHAAVRAALAASDNAWEPDAIDVEVEWGVVTLRGRVAMRSQAAAIANEVAAVDGVIAVDDELEWDVDDAIMDTLPY